MDLDYRRRWDNLTPEQLRICTLPSQFSPIPDLECIYWRVNFPMLLSDRDYVFLRQSKKKKTEDGCPCFVVFAESFSKSVEPPVKGVLRVTEYSQTIIFAPGIEDEKETRVYMEYFDNPGGNIPSAVINWAVSSGVPTFLSKLKNACHQYIQPPSTIKIAEKKEVAELRDVMEASLNNAFQL
ncbi:hypothetical protein HMI55_001902 [Coelomomyces lativittatus]|nr:hypothetical protein HMI55_001902 [Coelomomyces lativittatus]